MASPAQAAAGGWAGPVLIASALVLASVVVHVPAPFFLAFDDFTVLPERAFFDGDGAWLRHLLSFNQTRYTHVGDGMLFRPGLFLVYGLLDVLARADPWAQDVASALFMAAAGGGLYAFLRLRLGVLAALVLALAVVVPAGGLTIVRWTQISPYLLAYALLFLGTARLVRAEETGDDPGSGSGIERSMLPAFACLVGATLFHELAVGTLALAAAWLVTARTVAEARSGVPLRRAIALGASARPAMVCGGAAAMYAVLFAVNWLAQPAPIAFAPGRPVSAAFWERLGGLGRDVASIVVPFGDKAPAVAAAVLAVLVVLAIVVAGRRSRGAADPVSSVATALVLFTAAGLVAGRVAERPVTDWYGWMLACPMIAALGVGLGAAVEGRTGRLSRLGWAAILVAVFVSVCLSALDGRRDADRRMAAEAFPRAAVTVLAGIIGNTPGVCFGGFVPGAAGAPDLPAAASEMIAIALYRETCGPRPGKPVHARLAADGGLELVRPGGALDSAAFRVLDSGRWRPVEPVWRLKPGGLWPWWPGWTRAGGRVWPVSGPVEAAMSDLPPATDAIAVTVSRAKEDPQERFNVGLILETADGGPYLILLRENLVLVGRGRPPVPRLEAAMPLPRLPERFRLAVRRQDGACVVFADAVAVVTVRRCESAWTGAGLLRWDNGTAAEELTGLAAAGPTPPLRFEPFLGTG